MQTIIATISNPKITNGFFKTNLILVVIEVRASILLKIISGILKKVKKDASTVITVPT